MLKIVYLRSYEGMGRADVVVCGNRLELSLEGLFADYETYRYSVPVMYTFPMPNDISISCDKAPPSARTVDIVYKPEHWGYDPIPRDISDKVRGNRKMKIFSVTLCYYR
jgi:hypothetical protein